MYVCNCVTAVPAIGSPFPQRGKMKDEQTVTYHLYVATLPSWMSSSLASSRTATATAAWPRWFSLTGHCEMVQHGLY